MNLRRIVKALAFIAAGLATLIGLLLLGMKLALDRAPRYQAEIKDWVHRQTGYHIAFAAVSPAFRWYGPELYLSRLELRSRDDLRVLARAAGGRVGMDIWQLLRNGKLFALRVELDAPDIVIDRLGPSKFALASEIVLGGEGSPTSSLTLNDLPAGTLVIRQGSISLRHWNTELPQLELRAVDLDLSRVHDFCLDAPFGAFACRSRRPTELHGNRERSRRAGLRPLERGRRMPTASPFPAGGICCPNIWNGSTRVRAHSRPRPMAAVRRWSASISTSARRVS